MMTKNPDSEFVRNLKKKIKSNSGYCPNKQKGNPDNKCPCSAFRNEGKCDCGMYVEFPGEDDRPWP